MFFGTAWNGANRELASSPSHDPCNPQTGRLFRGRVSLFRPVSVCICNKGIADGYHGSPGPFALCQLLAKGKRQRLLHRVTYCKRRPQRRASPSRPGRRSFSCQSWLNRTSQVSRRKRASFPDPNEQDTPSSFCPLHSADFDCAHSVLPFFFEVFDGSATVTAGCACNHKRARSRPPIGGWKSQRTHGCGVPRLTSVLRRAGAGLMEGLIINQATETSRQSASQNISRTQALGGHAGWKALPESAATTAPDRAVCGEPANRR